MDASVERERRRAVWIVVIGAVLGAVLIALARGTLPSISPDQAPLVLAAVRVLAVVPLLGLAVHIWRLGARALRTAQFPPSGTVSTTEWRVFAFAERGPLQWLRRSGDPAAEVRALGEHLAAIIPTVPGVRDIAWERD